MALRLWTLHFWSGWGKTRCSLVSALRRRGRNLRQRGRKGRWGYPPLKQSWQGVLALGVIPVQILPAPRRKGLYNHTNVVRKLPSVGRASIIVLLDRETSALQITLQGIKNTIFQCLTDVKNTLPLFPFSCWGLCSSALGTEVDCLCERKNLKTRLKMFKTLCPKKVWSGSSVNSAVKKKMHWCLTSYPGFTDTYQLFSSSKTNLKIILPAW